MKKHLFLLRILALFLTLTLGLPHSLWAMRAENPLETGLEEKIARALGRRSIHAAGLEEGRSVVVSLDEAAGKRWTSLIEQTKGKRLGAGSFEEGVPWFDNGRMNLAIAHSSGEEAMGTQRAVVVSMEPDMWSLDRAKWCFGIQPPVAGAPKREFVQVPDGVFFRGSKWDGMVDIEGERRAVSVHLEAEAGGRLLMSTHEADRVPALLALAAFFAESEQVVAPPTPETPLQLNWLPAPTDMAYDARGTFFVVSDGRVSEFDLIRRQRNPSDFSRKRADAMNGYRPERLELDPASRTLFVLGSGQEDQVIFQTDADRRRRPQPIAALPHWVAGHPERYFVGDLAYDPRRKRLLVLKQILARTPSDKLKSSAELLEYRPSDSGGLWASKALRSFKSAVVAVAYDSQRDILFTAEGAPESPFQYRARAYHLETGNKIPWEADFGGLPADIHYDRARHRLYLIHSNGIQAFDFSNRMDPVLRPSPIRQLLTQPLRLLSDDVFGRLFVLEQVTVATKRFGRVRAFSEHTGQPAAMPAGIPTLNRLRRHQPVEGDLKTLHGPLFAMIEADRIRGIAVTGDEQIAQEVSRQAGPVDQYLELRRLLEEKNKEGSVNVRWDEKDQLQIHLPGPRNNPSAGLEEVGQTDLSGAVRRFVENLRPAAETGGVTLFSKGALEGGEGVPALEALLLELPKSYSAEEWRKSQQRIVIHAEAEEQADRFRRAGYTHIARWSSEIPELLALHAGQPITFFMVNESDRYLHGELAAAVSIEIQTVHLTADNFLVELARLFEILGYIKPSPQELKPLDESLRQAA